MTLIPGAVAGADTHSFTAGTTEAADDYDGQVLTIGGPLCFHCLTDPEAPDDQDAEDVAPAVTQVLGTAVCAHHAVVERRLIRHQLHAARDSVVNHLSHVDAALRVADGGDLS